MAYRAAAAKIPKRRRGSRGLAVQAIVLVGLAVAAGAGARWCFYSFAEATNAYVALSTAASHLAQGQAGDASRFPEGVSAALAKRGPTDEVTSQHIDVLLFYASTSQDIAVQLSSWGYALIGTCLVMAGLAVGRLGKMWRAIIHMED